MSLAGFILINHSTQEPTVRLPQGQRAVFNLCALLPADLTLHHLIGHYSLIRQIRQADHMLMLTREKSRRKKGGREGLEKLHGLLSSQGVCMIYCTDLYARCPSFWSPLTYEVLCVFSAYKSVCDHTDKKKKKNLEIGLILINQSTSKIL